MVKMMKMVNKSKRVIKFTGNAVERFSVAMGVACVGVHVGCFNGKSNDSSRRWHDTLEVMPHLLVHIKLNSSVRSEMFDEYGDPQLGKELAAVMYEAFRIIRRQLSPMPSLKQRERRVGKFLSALGLNDVERKILKLAVLINIVEPRLEEMAHACPRISRTRMFQTLAVLLGYSLSDVETALSVNSSIVRFGLLKNVGDNGDQLLTDWLELDSSMRRWLLSRDDDSGFPIGSRKFQGEIPCSTKDFAFLKTHVDLAVRLLERARKERVSGVNILLVGRPGTGKTVLARALAQRLGCTLFEIANQDEASEALDAGERLNAYMRSQAALSSSGKALLLFDEAEDIVGCSGKGLFDFMMPRRSIRNAKSYANQMLEENPVPTIWTTNSTTRMDPAWLRRFMLIVEVPVPSYETRKQIVDMQISRTLISEEMRSALARSKDLSAGHLATVAKALKLAAPKNANEGDTICRTVLEAPLKMLTLSAELPESSRYAEYDPDFLNLEGGSAEKILSAARKQKKGRFLLSGPPGSGKTGFAHYVARELGRELICKTASSLLDCYIGNTEKNIAAMFEEAKAENAVLLLDEADSFFRDRAGAERSWEVTQVNELLARMEDFNGIFFCSTNFSDHFDPAAMRRFLFKVRFDYLTSEQAIAVARRIMPDVDWASPETAKHRDAIAMHKLLTPADFFNVKSRILALGETMSPQRFVHELNFEVSCKRESVERRVGFGL
jgi:SpoVK/Ycf46/Vps4 family AAA+-type ATPase